MYIRRSISERINAMNIKDKNLMKIHDVTCLTEVIYCYKNHKYKKLEDALNYAKIDYKKNQHEPIKRS